MQLYMWSPIPLQLYNPYRVDQLHANLLSCQLQTTSMTMAGLPDVGNKSLSPTRIPKLD